MSLQPLQQQLQSIYELELNHSVDDYLITDPSLAAHLDDSLQARAVDEKLLVRQQDANNLDLALYLDAAVVDRLSKDDPKDCLHDGNWIDFCTALEGISHFLYLTWNAAQGRHVSCLELEMQAEVDKFITSAYLIYQHHGQVPKQLHQRLFEDISFDPKLDEEELTRYRDANHYAGKYCQRLERRFLRLREHRGDTLLNELRRFYRLSLQRKIRRIEAMH